MCLIFFLLVFEAEKSVLLCGAAGGWGWQAVGTWVSVSREMVGFPAPMG